MVAEHPQDVSNLRREDLLQDYFDTAKRRRMAFVASALRTRSVRMRDILVYGAVNLNVSSEGLKSLFLSGRRVRKDEVADVVALADLGRLVLLQNLLEDDKFYGEKLLTLANELNTDGQVSAGHRRVLIEHHIVNGDLPRAQELLDESPDVDRRWFGYLRAEIQNPYAFDSTSSADQWLESFNTIFYEHDLAPIGLQANEDLLPFDRLKTSIPKDKVYRASERPLVSVVLTAFKPQEVRLLTSVNSILDQTWQNLELIIVNDCSGPSYDEIFKRLTALDDRITVIHASENRGTYVARNIGYAASNGDFITGQDDDDWSHPERIERQLRFMQTNVDAIGCRVNAIRCDENLSRVRVGFLPLGQNASSLFIRREAYEKAGGFIEARKAADTEYHYRIESVTGRRVETLNSPLSIIRLLQGSLSRGDFAPGWKHSSRSSFRSAYEYWHRTSSLQDLYLHNENSPQVAIPRRFRIEKDMDSVPVYDVVFVGDWHTSGVRQATMLDEVRALCRANYRIAIMHLDSGKFTTQAVQTSLNDDIQKLINENVVDEVFYDDELHARLLMLRNPQTLQFISHEPSKHKVDMMMVIADVAPSERDGTDIRYLVDECHDNAEIAFGVTPTWVPKDREVRDSLEYYLTHPILAQVDMPNIIDLDEWWHKRLWYRSVTPVVGRHSQDTVREWPSKRSTLQELYPTDGRYDVRILGGANTASRVLGNRPPCDSWTVYETGELNTRNFLRTLDYFVFYQHPQVIEAFERPILEALASGTVVILPTGFEAIFGSAALYGDPEDVRDIIDHYHLDFSVYEAQRQLARSVLDLNFSYDAYQNWIDEILTRQHV